MRVTEQGHQKFVPTCAMPGCNYKANRRCNICGKVYCVEHIGSSYVCDTCTALRQAEAEAQAKRTESTTRSIGLFIVLAGAVMLFLAYNLNGSPNPWVGVFVKPLLCLGGVPMMFWGAIMFFTGSDEYIS